MTTQINGVISENNKFALTQTAKGIFVIEKLEVCGIGRDITVTMNEVFTAAKYAVAQLKDINEVDKPLYYGKDKP